jgi:hypothetical protein
MGRHGARVIEALLNMDATTPVAMPMTMSFSSIAPAPDRTPPWCSRAIAARLRS